MKKWFYFTFLPTVIVVLLAFSCQKAHGQTVSRHAVTLSGCTTPSTVVGFNFYRSVVSGSGYTKINSGTPVPTCNFVDNQAFGGTTGKTYFYVATAVDDVGQESAFGNEVKAIIAKDPPGAPSGTKCSVDSGVAGQTCQ